MTADLKAAQQASAKLEAECAKNAHSSAPLATRVQEMEVQLVDIHGKLKAVFGPSGSVQLPVGVGKLYL